MELVVKGRNFEVPQELRKYLENKAGRLARHLQQQGIETVVELFSKQSKDLDQRAVVQMTMSVNGALLRSEEKAHDFYTAIDSAVDTLDRQIERYKGKLYGRHRPGAAARASVARKVSAMPGESDTLVTKASKISKMKAFPVEPMDGEEAIERMELLDHDFFVFLNVDTSRMAIVYRRKDGGYGLLDPQLA